MHPVSKPPVGTPLEWGHPLNRGLVSHWPMWEGNGSAIRDTTAMTLGTLTGGAAWTGGIHGPALAFNGTTSYVACPSLNGAVLLNNFTLAGWIYPTSLPSEQAVIGRYPYLKLSTVGANLRFTTHFVKDYDATGSPLVVNRWWHYAIVMDSANNVTFYLNGATYQVVTGTSPANPGAADFNIGEDGAALWWNGSISDIRIYSRALPPLEIWQLYSQPYGMFRSAPMWWYVPPAPTLKPSRPLGINYGLNTRVNRGRAA